MAYFAYMVSMVYIPKEVTISSTEAQGRVAQRQMNPTEIEFAVRDLVAKPYEAGEFPYELIGIYNASKVTVSRLKSGQTNAAKQPGDVLWKKHLFFRPAGAGEDVGAIGDALAADPLTAKHKPRFILVANGEQVHARDTQRDDTLNVEFTKLDENSDFLLPLAGFERRNAVEEHPADIKAAKKLKKLYDAILAANPAWNSGHHTHELNLLMTRLLFCFYAEDTGIFDSPQVFTNTVTQHTTEDGADVSRLLDRLFRIMNVEESKRPRGISAVEAKFPYVNGSLFEDTVAIPQFNRTARRQLLECGDLDWTTINPDIFGSMIQTIAHDGTRSDLGMHYTSVPNILKVLQPLFLDELQTQFDMARNSVAKLETLLDRISRIRIFDPACGSGNFLIIAYKELRKLEIQTLQQIADISRNTPLRLSGIRLDNFFGLDIVDFATETAKLSLWVAEHQMNTLFRQRFGSARPTLPLAKIATIHTANALKTDWLDICPDKKGYETFLCGNPPYSGRGKKTDAQRADLEHVLSNFHGSFNNIDYIAGWFIKGAEYAKRTGARFAFVTTNSIAQGEHISKVWPLLLDMKVEIVFAHRSFKWANNAAHNAGITCAIIGIAPTSTAVKRLFTAQQEENPKSINPYLLPGPTIIVSPISNNGSSDRPTMDFGNMPRDGGHLFLSGEERKSIIDKYPEAKRFVRRFLGADEFINGLDRFCLWINADEIAVANGIPPIQQRIKSVRSMRLESKAVSTRSFADRAYRFVQIQGRDRPAIIIPRHTSERREWLQIGLVDKHTIIGDSAFAIYDPPAHFFAIIASKMHTVWAKTIGGSLETRVRYSNTLVYNTFPIPQLSAAQKTTLNDNAKAILKARAAHPGKSIAWLYDPDTMPADLRAAHLENDVYLETAIYGKSFANDSQRLEHLFTIYKRHTTQVRII